MIRAGRILSWMGLVVWSTAGCHRPREDVLPVFLSRLSDQTSAAVSGGFSEEKAQPLVQRALQNSRHLEFRTDGDERFFAAQVIIMSADERLLEGDARDQVTRSLLVDITLKRFDERRETEQFSARGEARAEQARNRVPAAEGFRTLLSQALAAAVESLDLQLEVGRIPIERLEQMLTAGRVSERISVLRALREKRIPELSTTILACLRDSEESVMLEAIGTLVAYREPAAVAPLIRLTEGKDALFQLQIITALSEIGGPEARGYLFTLAAGSTTRILKDRAVEALQQLEEVERRSGFDPGTRTASEPYSADSQAKRGVP